MRRLFGVILLAQLPLLAFAALADRAYQAPFAVLATISAALVAWLAREFFFHSIHERLPHQTELILNSAGDGMIGLNRKGLATYVNPAAARILGYEPSELLGKDIHPLIHHTRLNGESYPEKACPVYAAFTDGAVHVITDELFWRKDGTKFPVECASTPIRDDGQLVGAVMVFRDLSERMRIEELTHLSHHDPLTGLPNRRLFADRVYQALLLAQRQQQPLAFLMLDLNGFKQVNDMFGHDAGNLLLRRLAPRLRAAMRESDTIARLGGDEFALLLPNTDLEGAQVVVHDVLRCFETPFGVGGNSVKIGASIGVAFADADTDADLLERRADEAMYRAKRARLPYAVYRAPRSSETITASASA